MPVLRKDESANETLRRIFFSSFDVDEPTADAARAFCALAEPSADDASLVAASNSSLGSIDDVFRSLVAFRRTRLLPASFSSARNAPAPPPDVVEALALAARGGLVDALQRVVTRHHSGLEPRRRACDLLDAIFHVSASLPAPDCACCSCWADLDAAPFVSACSDRLFDRALDGDNANQISSCLWRLQGVAPDSAGGAEIGARGPTWRDAWVLFARADLASPSGPSRQIQRRQISSGVVAVPPRGATRIIPRGGSPRGRRRAPRGDSEGRGRIRRTRPDPRRRVRLGAASARGAAAAAARIGARTRAETRAEPDEDKTKRDRLRRSTPRTPCSDEPRSRSTPGRLLWTRS